MEEKFAKGLCKEKYFFVLLISSFIGSIYEDLYQIIYNLINNSVFYFDYHRAVIYEPLNLIYGFGAVIITYLFVNKSKSNIEIIISGSLLGGFIEYMVSLFQSLFLNTISWDYSDKLLNIGGRTTIPIMIVWGIFTLIFVKLIYPFISSLIEKIPPKLGKKIFVILLIVLSIDILISWTALFRQTLRKKGIKPITQIGEIYDKIYTDEFLKKYYSNMVML